MVDEMQMTSKQIYNSFIQGAYNVILNKEILNKINIFPVQDGDTGSNLASMMRAIIQKSEYHITVKETLESIADAALYGARGNSGIIFAQYFRGLGETIEDGESISISAYANASMCAAQYAYDAIEVPIEGTIITIMREWGRVLSDESLNKDSIEDIFHTAFKKTELALDKTKEQLPVLKKANVVDSGAKGFTYFIEGALYYIRSKENFNLEILKDEADDFEELTAKISHSNSDCYRYCTECLLESDSLNLEEIRQNLKHMGGFTVVAGSTLKCRIHIHTNDPAGVFRYLYQQGSVIYQKVDDIFKQESVVNHRKSNIVLITDSIADLPEELIDEEQIQVIHLGILYKDITYLDKLTIWPLNLLEMTKMEKELPTSSQPSPKHIENLFDYLSTYYTSIIVMTVSKKLSGTYNNFINEAKKYADKSVKISIINTRQNSGAQGLLVKKCAQYIKEGLTHKEIVSQVEHDIRKSKILVQVRNLDHMIKSGRLNIRIGKIAKQIGMKPIVSLDAEGNGILESIAFSINGSNKKIIQHIQKTLKRHQIEEYNIVHVNNEPGAKELAKTMTGIIGFEPAYIMETSSIIAISAGDGAVAISYLLKEEVS